MGESAKSQIILQNLLTNFLKHLFEVVEIYNFTTYVKSQIRKVECC